MVSIKKGGWALIPFEGQFLFALPRNNNTIPIRGADIHLGAKISNQPNFHNFDHI
jgi:hypothetical protein